MKIKTPLTRARLRTHMTYHSWKYIIVLAGCIFGWNLLYTTTAYRSPEHLRVDMYIQSATVTEESVAGFAKPIWDECIPEMETVSSVIMTGSTDDYYTNMQLSVYMMAGEGDIYMLSTHDFKTYAAQEVFLNLQPFIDSGAINVDGIDLSAGYVAVVNEDGLPVGEKQLFGIPAYTLDGLAAGMNLKNSDIILGVTAYNGNEENVIKFFNGLIQAGRSQAAETAN